MAEKIKQDVSGTAFVVNYSRSKMVEVSKDIYADLWVTPDSMSLWNDLANNVYPNDDLNVSLRNRFYLERLRKFINDNKNPILISIAAGFDNYPFLVDGNCKFSEIDLPSIIELKRNKVTQWMKEKRLPARNVEYISVDLNDKDQRITMKETLRKMINGNPSFATMEGIIYYLKKEVLNDIFGMLGEVQKKGSLMALDYWKTDAMEYPVMVKLKEHLEKNFGDKSHDWTLFDDTYLKGIKDFAEIESSDIAKLELEYSKTRIFQSKGNKIPVYFSVLKRV